MSKHNVHFVSDSTGETVIRIARAALTQFKDVEVQEHIWPFIHTPGQLEETIAKIADNPGIILYTLVGDDLRRLMVRCCERHGLPYVSILGPLIRQLEGYLKAERRSNPGRLHELNDEYFNRIDSLDFAVEHDDGVNAQTIEKADVILLGVSRMSKTPTCIYLAYRGVKAANIPLVPGIPEPPELTELFNAKNGPLIVGLTQDVHQLQHMRHNRLQHMANDAPSNMGSKVIDYADKEKVRDEILYAKRLYAKHNIPTVDVTRRSIEETAALIIQLLYKDGRNLNVIA